MVNATVASLIESRLQFTPRPDPWESRCTAQLLSSHDQSWTNSLVGEDGSRVFQIADAWGITIAACFKYCNRNNVPFAFNFPSFSNSLSNYFLPWLALTAQLPSETGSPWNSTVSWLLAVGSPALVTYSLTLTILNRFWVRGRFNELRSKARLPSIREKFNGYEDRIKACQLLLEEAQQVPLRASQEQGWLSSLIVIPGNDKWWDRLEERLKRSRRGVTASLVAQMLFAAIAFLFTVISSFDSDLGDPTTALQIASGSLWIWLIPVIMGWITVGTQNTHSSIQHALGADSALLALTPQVYQPGEKCFELSEQKAIAVRGGLNPLPHRDQTGRGVFAVDGDAHLKLKLPAGVGGDEPLKGPIFNYARPFTWWQLSTTVDEALWKTLDGVSTGKICAGAPQWSSTVPGKECLSGDSQATAEYCELQKKKILAYPEWSELPFELKMRMVYASLVALLLQWGTSGASITIAYNTPTVGLGCRSASYIAYGSIATAAWLCLVGSMLLSHEVMLRYQRLYGKEASIDFRTEPRTWSHSALFIAAGGLRVAGRTLAGFNAVWLITSSLMEICGGFDNCWCNGIFLGMGDKGYVILFKSAAELAASAKLPWGGGLAMTLIVCSVVYLFFFFGARKVEET